MSEAKPKPEPSTPFVGVGREGLTLETKPEPKPEKKGKHG